MTTAAVRVLVVEDDDDHLFLIRRSLKDLAGVTVDVARTGEQALDHLRRGRFDSQALPQLVLLDLKLPRLDGLEVLARIRADAALRSLPVVVLTSSEREEDREQALRVGATWYVCKPVDGARFRAEVEQVAARWARGPRSGPYPPGRVPR
ncbi:MAG TPA: response regulator [Actinomycetes bacterium]|jgi:CheY-like chemotaxis protein|nr:response regulator [Actinomycetes bacterium]